eukprot:GILJ01005292.1.p1 GENE.GILJ01005292.1~~GILJ01005292.1.p1  ORF type:complete len:587 (+),score=114.12 GILJ01005292.1:124-1884(+)
MAKTGEERPAGNDTAEGEEESPTASFLRSGSEALKKMQSIADRLVNENPELQESRSSSPNRPGKSKKPSPAMQKRSVDARAGSANGLRDASGLELQTYCQELQEKYNTCADDKSKLEVDIKRRQERYIRREAEYRRTIEDLQKQLRSRGVEVENTEQMKTVQTIHSKIMDNINNIQGKTAKILQDQEKDLVRAFRSRLADIQKELEMERNKRSDGAQEWIDKNRKLTQELDWTKEMADKLDRANQQLTKENHRLKTQFKTQEEDREFLVRQMVQLKKENGKLRDAVNQLIESNDSINASTAAQLINSLNPVSSVKSLHQPESNGLLSTPQNGTTSSTSRLDRTDRTEKSDRPDSVLSFQSSPSSVNLSPIGHNSSIQNINLRDNRSNQDPNSAAATIAQRRSQSASSRARSTLSQLGGLSGNGKAKAQKDKDERYQAVVEKLKRLLDIERKNLRNVRTAHSREIASRTELEVFLRQCIDDVKQEIAKRRNEMLPKHERGYGFASISRENTNPRDIPLDDFSAADRQRVLELLLSQERVLSLLYDKAFPARSMMVTPRYEEQDFDNSDLLHRPDDSQMSSDIEDDFN